MHTPPDRYFRYVRLTLAEFGERCPPQWRSFPHLARRRGRGHSLYAAKDCGSCRLSQSRDPIWQHPPRGPSHNCSTPSGLDNSSHTSLYAKSFAGVIVGTRVITVHAPTVVNGECNGASGGEQGIVVRKLTAGTVCLCLPWDTSIDYTSSFPFPTCDSGVSHLLSGLFSSHNRIPSGKIVWCLAHVQTPNISKV